MLISLLLCIIFSSSGFCVKNNILFVILGQESKYDTKWSLSLVESIINQYVDLYEKHNSNQSFFNVVQSPLFYHFNGSESLCYWQILALSERLIEDPKQSDKEWFIFLDSFSNVRLPILLNFTKSEDPSTSVYFGHGLKDDRMSITHHYYGFYNDDDPPFYYPDISAGIVMSRPLLKTIYESIKSGKKGIPQFTIDAYHELARYALENAGTRLTNKNELFCLSDIEDCAIYYTAPQYECNAEKVYAKDVKAYVKTWSGNHQKRLPYIVNTWGKEFETIEYISDQDSNEPPTKNLGVRNTERGHCGKTFAIIKKFVEEDIDQHKWLLVADDDSLINPEALTTLLSCYDTEDALIIGERYGFGASISSRGAYNYPTGGAGMLFSRTAAKWLTKTCTCPNVDSPDDMIIGMCSLAQEIPIIHSPAFHQAQPWDYPQEYREKIWPVSYHKFFESDPIEMYQQHVQLERPRRPENYKEPIVRYYWYSWDDVMKSTEEIRKIHLEL